MQNELRPLSTKAKFDDPILCTEPEIWQWEVLTKAFLGDPTISFWFKGKEKESELMSFFEGIVKEAFTTGGTVFGSTDQKAVIVWTWLGNDKEAANPFKKQWHNALGSDGVKRYHWLYDQGDVALEKGHAQRSMEPAYIAVLPEFQGKGYGSHIFKWSFDHVIGKGYDAPFILASSRRSAKLYCPLLGFYAHKEVFGDNDTEQPIAVFLKRQK
nr:GNAT family N-acetyltransferase [uncultured Chryseobacterium sp.]